MNAKLFGILGLLLALCLFLIVMTSDPWLNLSGSTFLKPSNIVNVLRRISMYGILGIGVAFVIITSGIDLSVGSVICLAACVLAICLHVNYEPFSTQSTLAVTENGQQIVLAESSTPFKSGDKVYYEGANSRQGTVASVIEVNEITHRDPQGREHAVAALKVDQQVRGDRDGGRVSPAIAIQDFSVAADQKTSVVTLAQPLNDLAARDRISLVPPQQSSIRVDVVSSEVAGDRTNVVVRGSLRREFNNQWVAVLLERRPRMSIPMALFIVLGMALGLGLIHGLLITKLRLQPFVVTLCGLLIYRGLSRWIVNDQPVGFGTEYTDSLVVVGSGTTMGVPNPLFILVAVGIVSAIFLNKTIWGRYILALGRNEEAARYSGINTGRMTVIAYVICTMLAAIGGILFALDSNSISPSNFGNSFELYAIAAAVLGGCSLRGGEGTITGVIIGTAVMQVLYNLINLLKINVTLEYAIVGTVILIGVIADELIKRVAASRRRKLQARA